MDQDAILVEIGKVNSLAAVGTSKFGTHFDGGTMGKILLPRSHMRRTYKRGEFADIFVYRDQEQRLLGSDQAPHAVAGEVAFLKVVGLHPSGAFVDLGIPKDLFVPASQQQKPMEIGRFYLVYVYIDEMSGRIAGSAKLGRFLDQTKPEYAPGTPVELIIEKPTDIGFTAIINHRHRGLLYNKEIFLELSRGQKVPGFVSRIREDGKIDLSLQARGYEKVTPLATLILERLKSEGGRLPLGDESSPDRIKREFGVSKKTFKKALGALYKQRLIVISPEEISLVKPDQP